MKNVFRVLAIALFAFACWISGGQQETLAVSFPQFTRINTPILAQLRNEADSMLNTEFGQKIDLNNTNVRGFRGLPGFYPTLATKIVGNAPYKAVEDVLGIPGLSESQKQRLQANLENFTVVQSADVFTQGDDRLNNGIYD
ncbi:MAG: photosystem II complex extrinsic protein PsbU [Cyanobacteria bacterium SBLK]|nr:photosystem II complex extrinsic protein PsbU [Cyanobacteria bacterium SBLK]